MLGQIRGVGSRRVGSRQVTAVGRMDGVCLEKVIVEPMREDGEGESHAGVGE